MTTTRRFLAGLALALTTSQLAGSAQTASQQLEKAIFTQDTVGDLDGAVTMYRQILTIRFVPGDVESETRVRLAEALRRKGQAPQARAAGAQEPSDGCCGIFSNNYDVVRPVTVTGALRMVMWVNPMAVVIVDGSDGNKWGFTLAAPNLMIRGGLNKATLRPGEMVTVRGFLATGQDTECPKALPNACQTLEAPVAPEPAQSGGAAGAHAAPGASGISGALHASARSIVSSDGRNLFDRPAMERAAASAQARAEDAGALERAESARAAEKAAAAQR